MPTLLVRSITYEAEGILSFELVHPDGAALPPVEAGAHLDVCVPGGLTRRYSLCDAPWEASHYRIAVLDVPGGRGGSRAMHQQVRAGQLIEVGGPHNFFPLHPGTRRALLLAGGIGVTPILSMIEQLSRDGTDWELHYCTQTPARTAFRRRLMDGPHAERVHLHHDGGDPRQGLDIAALLRQYDEGTHLYYCGPTGFMKAVQAATTHWPAASLHHEYFGADASPLPAPTGGTAGELVLQRAGRNVMVAPGQSILQALRSAGVECASSCEAGVCGTCAVSYTGGRPVHNDFVLSDEERSHKVVVCCAQVGPEPLCLDI